MNVFVLRGVMKRYHVPLSLRTSASELPVLWNFGLPTVLGGLVSAPVYWACNAMLVNRQGGYAEMGILNAANQWWAAVLFLPGMLGQVVLPVMTERLSSHSHAQARRLLWASAAGNLAIVTPVIILASILSRNIMASYGSQFAGARPTLIVLMVAAGMQALQTPVLNLLTAKGRMWTILLLLLSWASVLLAVNSLFVKWGALGVASARMVSYFVSSLWISYVAYRLVTADAAHDSNDIPMSDRRRNSQLFGKS